MKFDLTPIILDWQNKPIPTKDGYVTVFDLIIPQLFNSHSPQLSKEQKDDICKLATKVNAAKDQGEVELVVDELKIIQDNIEPGLVAIASKQFMALINGAKGKKAPKKID